MIGDKKILSRISIPVSLLVLTLLAYWPLLGHCMKFDILDQYLPWRYLVGQTLQCGHLPLWNPYTHLGYPIYADPQSGAWYPVVWLIGGVFGYNIYWIQTEYLFHVWLAGYGMFLLVKALVNNEKVAWLAGASFLLSGFFTGNAQHLTWIISGAWIPFILYYFLLMSRGCHWRHALLCAICFLMLFTGGYPAFSIVFLYILLVLIIVVITRKIYCRQPSLDFIKSLMLFIVISLLLSTVMLVSVAESFRIAGRAEGLSRELAMENPFSPQSLFSFLFPLSSVKDAVYFQTDTSMSNGYFGLIMLAGLMISISRKKTFVEIVIFCGSLILLMAAMGSYTPLRGWLYDYIPLMNLFRMPSLFRLFVIIGFILLGAFSLTELLNDKNGNIKLANVLKILGVGFLLTVIYFIFQTPDGDSFKMASYTGFFQEMKFRKSVLLQGIVQMVCLFIILVVLKKKYAFPLFVIDGVLACWMCAPVTMVSGIRTGEFMEMTRQLPMNFSVPELTPMNQNLDRTGTIGPLWCNLGIWKKQPIIDGYNNFQTKNYLKYEQSPLAKFVVQNPVVYISHASSIMQNNYTDTVLLANDHTHLLIDKPVSKEFAHITEIEKQIASLELQVFTPSKIEAMVNGPVAGYLTLLQQFDDGWKVFVDNKEQEIVRSNGMFISTNIPVGKHIVSFVFTNQKITWAFYISAAFLIIVLSTLLVKIKKQVHLEN